MEKEIMKQVNNSPAEMIQRAIEGKADLSQLKELLSLQREWEAGEAKKAYYKAMAGFKANPPKIDKDRTVAFNTAAGKTSYNHASLANVTEKISAELSKYGLSASWITKQNGTISVTCRITHELGYGEETTISAPSDVTGSKNAIQAIGSTITYLERYTLLALTGLATYDQEDDAVSASKPVEFIDDEQKSVILDFFAALETSPKQKEQFYKFMKIEGLDKMTTADFPKAVNTLKTTLEQKAKAGKK